MKYNPVHTPLSFLWLALLVFFSIVSVHGQTTDNLPLRLKVATYSVGHFNQGRLGGFQWTDKPTTVTAELNNWKKWIGKQGLDILGLNEWNRSFDKDSIYNAEEELLKPYYSNVYFG